MTSRPYEVRLVEGDGGVTNEDCLVSLSDARAVVAEWAKERFEGIQEPSDEGELPDCDIQIWEIATATHLGGTRVTSEGIETYILRESNRIVLCACCSVAKLGTGCPVPGVLLCDGFVECCDECAVFSSDYEAALALKAEVESQNPGVIAVLRYSVDHT